MKLKINTQKEDGYTDVTLRVFFKDHQANQLIRDEPLSILTQFPTSSLKSLQLLISALLTHIQFLSIKRSPEKLNISSTKLVDSVLLLVASS